MLKDSVFARTKKTFLPNKRNQIENAFENLVSKLPSAMSEVNTSRNEASHSLMASSLPKDIHVARQYEGRMGLAVLVWNYQKHDTLLMLGQLFEVTIPDRLLNQAISRDNVRTRKREWTKTFAPEIIRAERERKEKRKKVEEEYKKQVEKERPIVVYGEKLDELNGVEDQKRLIGEVDGMKNKQLDYYLSQFPMFNRNKKWKKLKVKEKKERLAFLLTHGEAVAMMERKEWF